MTSETDELHGLVKPPTPHDYCCLAVYRGGCRRLQGFPAMLAAVCDLPRMCEGCDNESTIRPVRERTPTIVTAVSRETKSSDKGDGKDDVIGPSSAFAIFRDAPRLGLGFMTRVQVCGRVPGRRSKCSQND